jgi:hypothetical protein
MERKTQGERERERERERDRESPWRKLSLLIWSVVWWEGMYHCRKGIVPLGTVWFLYQHSKTEPFNLVLRKAE